MKTFLKKLSEFTGQNSPAMESFLVIFRLRTATLQKKEFHDKGLDKFKHFQMNFFTEHLQATTSDVRRVPT